MRNACKTLAGLSLTFGLLFVCASHARADITDDHLISARAGIVNLVSGDAMLRRAGESVWLTLRVKDELKSGDAVRTGAGARVEVLLNPGSYLRLGDSSEFELTDASLDSLRIKLAKGGAVVEAAGFDDSGFTITVNTPQTQVSVVRAGVYRFDVTPLNTTELRVQKGRALVGGGRVLVKEGMAARVGASGAVEVAKFDKKDRDALDLWSRDRAEEVARVNRALELRTLNARLASFAYGNPYFGSSFGGVWLWGSSCYTFMPFVMGFSSPYGFGYPAWMFWPAEALYGCGCEPRYYGGAYFRRFPRPTFSAGGNTMSNTTTTTGTQIAPKPAKTTSPGGGDYSKPSPGGGGSFKPPSDFSRPVFNTSPASPSPATHASPSTTAPKGTSPRDN
ncbi:MAG: FecR family protein [Acidobacteria bacterium]|nr:FecR family protein [Acidobacteriota bacterium]